MVLSKLNKPRHLILVIISPDYNCGTMISLWLRVIAMEICKCGWKKIVWVLKRSNSWQTSPQLGLLLVICGFHFFGSVSFPFCLPHHLLIPTYMTIITSHYLITISLFDCQSSARVTFKTGTRIGRDAVSFRRWQEENLKHNSQSYVLSRSRNSANEGDCRDLRK